MSVRTMVKELDLNKMLRKVTLSLGRGGGGHRNAAGARIPENTFIEFLDKLNREIKQAIK